MRLIREVTRLGAWADYTEDFTKAAFLEASQWPTTHRNTPPMFRIDVSAEPGSAPGATNASNGSATQATLALLHQIATGQQKQNQLLEQLVEASVSAQKQRAHELEQWKDANPRLAKSCRRAAEKLSRVQTEFLESLTEEIDDNGDHLLEGEYMLNEFVDRFGPRLAHLNGVLQVLAQLGNGVPAQQQ